VNADLANKATFVRKDQLWRKNVLLDFIQKSLALKPSLIASNVLQDIFVLRHHQNLFHVRLELILQEAAKLRQVVAQSVDQEPFAK
jgi:hypothetical protein